MYRIYYTQQALSDKKRMEKYENLSVKAGELIEVLRNDPYQKSPPYENVVCGLPGIYWRRISIQYRLVYSVDDREQAVRILRLFVQRWMLIPALKSRFSSGEAEGGKARLPSKRTPSAPDGAAKEKPHGAEQPYRYHKVTHIWYLEKILLGLIEYDQVEDYVKFNLDFRNAVVFAVTRRASDGNSGYYDDTFCHILDSLCLDIFPETCGVYFIELEHKLVGVVLSGGPEDTFMDDVAACLGDLASHVQTLLSVNLFYSISDIHHHMDELSAAYEEANYTHTYDYLRSQTPRFSFYRDIKTQKCSHLDVPRIADVEKRYIWLITQYEFVKAKQELISFLDTIGSLEGLINRTVQTVIYDIVNMTLKGLSVLNQTDVERIFDKFPLIDEMFRVDNLGSLRERCLYIIDSLINHFDTKSMDIKDKIVAIQSYINEHYTDPNLSVDMLADAFSITAQHLSKSFKEIHGGGIQRYIVGVRIDNGKRLLTANESLSIEQVADETGFTSSQSFIRAFKRMEGVTPGQFRRA